MIGFGGEPDRGNIGMAVAAGAAVAIGCGLIWGLISYAIKTEFAIVAILVGFAVGSVMARIGRVKSPGFAIAAALLSVAGCALGSLFAEMLVLVRNGVSFSDTLAHFNVIIQAYPRFVGALGFVFWALAAVYGYRIAMGMGWRWGWSRAARAQRGPQPYGTAPYGTTGQPYGTPGQPYGTPGQAHGTPGQPYGAQPYETPGQPYGTPGPAADPGLPAEPDFGFKQPPPGFGSPPPAP